MNAPAHILLVEDNRMDIELTLDAFREARLVTTVHVAPMGKPQEIEGYWLSLNVGPPEARI